MQLMLPLLMAVSPAMPGELALVMQVVDEDNVDEADDASSCHRNDINLG